MWRVESDDGTRSVFTLGDPICRRYADPDEAQRGPLHVDDRRFGVADFPFTPWLAKVESSRTVSTRALSATMRAFPLRIVLSPWCSYLPSDHPLIRVEPLGS
jgi:hypothetical protein